jgi:DNA-3-methyladenine glycosylase II
MPHRAIHSRFIETARSFSSELGAAITRAGPIELTSRADLPFADYLCRAITGQQLSVKAAKTIWSRVEASAEGKPLTEHFCERNMELLRSCGLSGAKAKTVCAIADLARCGELKDDHLREMSAADRTAHITAIWGVGQWTADMMNMFYFGEPDIWPDGDVAARKTLERLTSKRRKTVRTARHFAPHRSYLALYMWAHADAPPV